MKRAFDIAFVGLKPGKHEFNYTLDDKFFTDKGQEDFSDVHATVKVTLEKNTGFMLLLFEVGGDTKIICDRCGNPLKWDLWDEFKMVVKSVDNPDVMNEQEEDPDVFYISRTESHLHLEDWIYEFVMLSLPMQRMCTPEEIGGPQCNKEVLAKLKAMETVAAGQKAETIWKGLEKFKTDNN